MRYFFKFTYDTGLPQPISPSYTFWAPLVMTAAKYWTEEDQY